MPSTIAINSISDCGEYSKRLYNLVYQMERQKSLEAKRKQEEELAAFNKKCLLEEARIIRNKYYYKLKLSKSLPTNSYGDNQSSSKMVGVDDHYTKVGGDLKLEEEHSY